MGKPLVADALANGLRWTVFHWQSEQAFPGFSQFIQKALNVEAKALRGEMEVFLEMWGLAQTSETGPDWPEIEQLVGKALSPCAAYIGAMSSYLQRHTGFLLDGVNLFLKAFARDDTAAALGGEYIQAVADLDFKKHKVPHVANALLEAQLLSPKVIDGICRTIVVSKVQRLKGEAFKGRVLQAENMMQEARELGRAMGVQDDPRYVRHIGFLDVRIIAVLIGMPKVFEKVEFASLEEVAKDCLNISQN